MTEIIDITPKCFVCLENCHIIYETNCDCIVYCCTSCKEDYENYYNNTCPICRNPIEEEEIEQNLYEQIQSYFLFICYLGFRIFIIPYMLGLSMYFIVYLINYKEHKNELDEYLKESIFELWLIGVILCILFYYIKRYIHNNPT